MDNLEQLERELALPISNTLERYLPVPDQVRLREIEQKKLFPSSRSQGWWFWALLLLGLSGLASAYLMITAEKKVEVHERSLQDAPMVDESQTNRQTFESNAVKDSPVIYQKEVLGNE